MRSTFNIKIVIIVLWLLLSFIFFWMWHNRTNQIFTYHGEIYADKAGYYIYLPFFLNYRADINALPSDIEKKTGLGFKIDEGKIITKYTAGVAILQIPFYLLSEFLFLVRPTGYAGFSLYHHKAIAFSGLFYSWIGFWFLFRFMRYYFEDKISFMIILSVMLATNTLYYCTKESNFSHIYSFFLISVYLFLLKKTDFIRYTNTKIFFIFLTTTFLIVLIRPTNTVLVFTVFLFLDSNSLTNTLNRIYNFFMALARYWWVSLAAFSIVILPQLLYWKYAYGHFITYSYKNEGFNWFNPHILEFLIAPNNGTFAFSPILVFILLGIAICLRRNYNHGYLLSVFFLIMVYLYSSWWCYSFGCSYGSRNMVDLYPLLSLGLGHFYKSVINQKKVFLITLFFLILFSLINIKMIFNFDMCMYVKNDWDWEAWIKLLL